MAKILDALRKAIESNAQTPSAIAKHTGVARSQLSRFLRRERGLSIEAAEKLAAYLGLEVVIRPRRRRRK
jgi:plasmid maintenance system antidote protein VapI